MLLLKVLSLQTVEHREREEEQARLPPVRSVCVFVGAEHKRLPLSSHGSCPKLTTQQLGKQRGRDGLCSVCDGGQVEKRVGEANEKEEEEKEGLRKLL